VAKSYHQLVDEARSGVTCTEPEQLKARLDAGEEIVLIDVREPSEWRAGTLPGAHPVPRGVLEGQVDARIPRTATIVLYCAAGARSALAAKSLKEMGFARVEHLEGGFSGWAGAGGAVEPPR